MSGGIDGIGVIRGIGTRDRWHQKANTTRNPDGPDPIGPIRFAIKCSNSGGIITDKAV